MSTHRQKDLTGKFGFFLNIPDKNDQYSARGDHQDSNRDHSKEPTSASTKEGGQVQTSIKDSEDCEMFKIVKLGKKLGEGAYGEVF